MASAQSLYKRGVKHHESGQLAQAEQCYRKVLQKQPRHADALFRLGILAQQTGHAPAALQLFDQAIAIAPRDDYYLQQGNTCQTMGRFAEAVTAYRNVVRLNPGQAMALRNLGVVLRQLGDHAGALESYRQALALEPDNARANFGVGGCYKYFGLNHQAINAYRRAIARDPGYADAWNNMAEVYRVLGDFEAAEAAYRETIRLQPGYHQAHSNLLYLFSYYVLKTPAEILAESRRWDDIHGAAGRAAQYVHQRPASAVERCLRIGYVSPDFRRHSVSNFFEPILTAHRQLGNVEVTCYAEQIKVDEVTRRLRGLANHWCEIQGRSDAEVAARIKSDGIDILIDLAGHTAHNRLGVFTYKPAPIQATYLGYFATTGLSAMDYWLSDEVLTPLDSVEQASEKIVRLPRCCLAYTPPSGAPDVSERPSDQALVFGNFNDLSKAGPGSVEAWSEILRRLPHSRLLLKAKQLGDAEQREAWWRRFEAEGIARERIDLRGRTADRQEHLALYGEVDIALDTMPRTGGATTAEALYMGVPVISLAGRRFIERISTSMLQAVGLEELVTVTVDDYISQAVGLGRDKTRRQALRKGLRQRITGSALCDARGLTQALETAYRQMWRQWLEPDTGGTRGVVGD